ncbi:hypothetical protein CRE_26283 [Caenorhabditis remanei]|uniref:F-box domain-containing protein n=1 Tax=Caenorhabditis remanei TaxID=31234 RepID=E3LR57_CAERE|nr:hypothetical protein CRE_26283 [Caenorhabditis remanei]
MPMKFFNFPHLVQENILNNMDFSDVFAMSLCSKRSKSCVILSTIKVPKLWHIVKENKQSVKIEDELGILKTVFKLKDYLQIEKTLKLKFGKDFLMTEFENDDKCFFIKVDHISETLGRKWNDHFNSLFRLTAPSCLKIDVSAFSKRTPKFENVNEIHLTSYGTLESEQLDSFLNQYSNLDFLKIEPSVNGDLINTSKILEVENIHLEHAEEFGMNLLKKFSGRNISLVDVFLVETELNEIIRKWIKGEAFQNLEAVEAMDFCFEGDLRADVIFDQVPIEEFDPTKRPLIFPYNRKFTTIMNWQCSFLFLTFSFVHSSQLTLKTEPTDPSLSPVCTNCLDGVIAIKNTIAKIANFARITIGTTVDV